MGVMLEAHVARHIVELNRVPNKLLAKLRGLCYVSAA